MDNEKILALAKFLEIEIEDIEEVYENTYKADGGEYMVLDDSEANTAFHESVENYIDECVLSEMPENLRYYFDNEKFERDVLLGDGRGPSLSSYDGAENEEQINGTYYFIYRTN